MSECYTLRLSDDPDDVEDVRRELRGRDLACWCPAELMPGRNQR